MDPEKIAGRYEVRKAIGSGARGQVFLAHDSLLDSLVAVKLLHHSGSDDAVIRFQNEAIATGKLKNSKIAKTLDFGLADGALYMVMEFVDGESLATVLEQQHALPPARALPLFLDICEALVHAHANGILHRDLKPANVIVMQSEIGEYAKLVDFGIAKIQGAAQSVTDPNAIVGSPIYMSPEQCKSQVADARSDIYSFGCLMFETLSGKPPFLGDTAIDTITMKSNQDAPSLSSATDATKIPEELLGIVDTCLKLKPEERYQNASAVFQALEEVTVEDRAPRPVVAVPKARLPKSAINVVLVVLAAFGIGAVSMYAILEQFYFQKGQNTDPGAQLQMTLGGFNTKAPAEPQPEPLPVLAKDEVPTSGHDSGTFLLQVQQQFPKTNDRHTASPSFRFNRQHPHLVEAYRMTQDEDFKLLAGRNEYTTLAIEHAGLLKGDGFKYIEKLPLKELFINETNILDSSIAYIGKMKSLEALHLNAASNITDQGLKHLVGLKKLRALEVTSSHVTNRGVEYLSKIKSLEHLGVMRAMRVNDDCVDSICSLPRLRVLMLSHTGVSSSGLARLVRCQKKLEQLQISGLPFSNESLDALSTLPYLQVLLMEDAKISDRELPKLAKLKNLITLVLDARQLTGDSIGVFKNSKLQYLNLRAPSVSSDLVRGLSTLNIRVLEIRSPKGLYDSQLVLFLSMPKLRVLNINDCNSREVTLRGMEMFEKNYFQRWKQKCEVKYDSRDMPEP